MKYSLACQIISGYEIATKLGDPSIQTHIRVNIGQKLGIVSTEDRYGNFPLYDHVEIKEV